MAAERGRPSRPEPLPPAAGVKQRNGRYRPLPSVWEGTDADLVERMLTFSPRRPPRRILDATVNAGRIWEGSRREVIGLDIDPRHRPTVVADNLRMPFADDCFDVVAYDPPHVPNQGRDRLKDFTT